MGPDLEHAPGRGRLAGKVALVIGGGSIGPGWGNGKAAAAVYAREGARVGFDSRGVIGLIMLTPHESGWVKVVAEINGRPVFTAFAEQVWEEYELYPDGWPDEARATGTHDAFNHTFPFKKDF